MKKALNKIANVLAVIFGYGILICLFAGGLTFVGYVVALCIGGETATAICVFIYKKVFPIIIYSSSVLVVLGVIKMYLSGEVALSIEKKRKKSKEKKEQRKQVSSNKDLADTKEDNVSSKEENTEEKA